MRATLYAYKYETNMSVKAKHAKHHNIPDDAICVFSWVRADIYQWNQEMYDGSSALFERIRFLDGAFVIAVTPQNTIILTKQTQPGRSLFYSLPGWSFDYPDELPLVCAERELLEETGYKSDDWKQWMRFDGTNNVMTYTYFFIARNCIKVQEIQPDPGENIEVFEMTFEEFLNLARDVSFHHHWNLLPYLYEALVDENKKDLLREVLFKKN